MCDYAMVPLPPTPPLSTASGDFNSPLNTKFDAPIRKSRVELVGTTTQCRKELGNTDKDHGASTPRETVQVPAIAQFKRTVIPEPVETTLRFNKLQKELPTPALTNENVVGLGQQDSDHINYDRLRKFNQSTVGDSASFEDMLRSSNATLDPKDLLSIPKHDLNKMHMDTSNFHSASHPLSEPIPLGATTTNEEYVCTSPNPTTTTDTVPSLSASVSSSTDSTCNKHSRRESCDERFGNYLLALATRTAEKQLKEQALAAFSSEHRDDNVKHFDYRDNGSSKADCPSPKQTHHEDDDWTSVRHQEGIEGNTCKSKPNIANTPYWPSAMTADMQRLELEHSSPQNLVELENMSGNASPPMLGSDLTFRKCLSPKMTKFESDQRSDFKPLRANDGRGLWGGYCVRSSAVDEGVTDAGSSLGLVHTPRAEETADHFSPLISRGAQTEGKAESASTPGRATPAGVQMLGLEGRPQGELLEKKEEAEIREEFTDRFVTQVYNYLSLGYPSLARAFDDELAKISGVDVKELRGDDMINNMGRGHRGFIDIHGNAEKNRLVPEGVGVEKGKWEIAPGEEGENDHGARWKALRLYIWERARQQHPRSLGGAEARGSRSCGVPEREV